MIDAAHPEADVGCPGHAVIQSTRPEARCDRPGEHGGADPGTGAVRTDDQRWGGDEGGEERRLVQHTSEQRLDGSRRSLTSHAGTITNTCS